MKARINFITLAVTDLRKSYEFYSVCMGLKSNGTFEGHEDHLMFELENGFSLVLYRRKDYLNFAADPHQASTSAGFIISQYVDSKEEVDDTLARALEGGAKPAGEYLDESWGYTAGFSDPDGHQWEIFYRKN
jgi:predicted lactoylglutathione lyase